jgi:hypothetical protein
MEKIKSYHDLLQDRNVLVQIDKVHAEIESENHYEASIKSPTLGDGNIIEMYVKAPDTSVRIHATVLFSGELGGIAEAFRSATVSLSGSVVTIFNNDHNSDNESTVAVRSSPALTGSGTQFAHFHVGGGFQGRDGGESASRIEWKLKQGTVYIFRYTSIAGSNEAEIEVAFYEKDEG